MSVYRDDFSMADEERYPGTRADVAYNIEPSDPSYNNMSCELSPFLTQSNLPRISYKEQRAVERCLFDSVYNFMHDNEILLFDEEDHDEVFGFESLQVGRGDRTIEIAQGPSTLLLNRHFVAMLQSRVLQCFPLWRVVIATIEDYLLCIYPDTLKLWPVLQTPQGQDPIDSWRSRVEHRFATELGDQRRQLAYVRQLVPNLTGDGFEHRCRLLVGFASYDGGEDQWSLWFLVEGRLSSDVTFDLREEIATGTCEPVNPDGSLGRFIVWQYDGKGNHYQKVNNFNFWLEQVIVPVGTADLTILNTSDKMPIQQVQILPGDLLPAWRLTNGIAP